jgi:phosphoserine / homoserine phosphotransferase
MRSQPTIFATDLEGVLIPEIWIAVAEKTGIDQLRLTTRDLPDYDELMQLRLRVLHEHHLTLDDIQSVIATLEPMTGAVSFLNWVRSRMQCVILSDTFYEFAMPLMAKLGYPALWCHSLEVDDTNRVVGYKLRLQDSKREAVRAMKQLGFNIIAVGDSYNDTGMLAEADQGILFRAPDNVVIEFPQFPVLHRYEDLRAALAHQPGGE